MLVLSNYQKQEDLDKSVIAELTSRIVAYSNNTSSLDEVVVSAVIGSILYYNKNSQKDFYWDNQINTQLIQKTVHKWFKF